MNDTNTSQHQHFSTFLSCDWGTSSFRLTLASWEGVVQGVISNRNGIAATYQKWKERPGSGSDRLECYLSVVREAVAEGERRFGIALRGMPLVVSGMASSSIGMITLPYGDMPFSLDGSDLMVHRIKQAENFDHPVYLISGIRSDDDVMRGEETQLVGVARDHPAEGQHLYIFPGTHSKHIRAVGGKAVAFTTYMTGEFFDVLSTKSILADSVSDGGGLHHQDNMDSFREGVSEGVHNNLLNSVFHVRTRGLLGGHGRDANYYFLSGLLIGSEIAGLSGGPVTLTGSESILPYYEEALRMRNVPVDTVADGAQAVVRGQSRIVRRLLPTC